MTSKIPWICKKIDSQDPLQKYQQEFHFPEGEKKWFTGNSLGLQPKRTKAYVDEVWTIGLILLLKVILQWKPDYHERFAKPLSKIVGALPSEVTVMNTLTVNSYWWFFYQPTKKI
jgi:kynureninase